MAKPRVFISSTCYDLKEIRSQIREFIFDYGYEPILSEFGDIFFDYGEHPQDSCFKEIEKCQMFVLIIGNSFGSTYYKTTSVSAPSSITMEEFAKSIKCNLPKHVFINRFVDYDYQNYVRAWDKYIHKLRDEGKLSEENAENKQKVRREFDDTYPFPQDSYRNLFRFIERIYAENVGVQTFEFSSDIKECLKDVYELPIDGLCKHEFVFDGLKDKSTGVTTMDVAKRLLDYGYHAPTIYFPLLFHESLMIEPTENESKETLDGFIAVMRQIAEEAKTQPETVKSAPHHTPISRVDDVLAAKHPITTYRQLLADDATSSCDE